MWVVCIIQTKKMIIRPCLRWCVLLWVPQVWRNLSWITMDNQRTTSTITPLSLMSSADQTVAICPCWLPCKMAHSLEEAGRQAKKSRTLGNGISNRCLQRPYIRKKDAMPTTEHVFPFSKLRYLRPSSTIFPNFVLFVSFTVSGSLIWDGKIAPQRIWISSYLPQSLLL